MTAAIAATLALGLASAAAQDRSQTRSMVISQLGVVATEQPLAAEAGAAILARGGNAVDAAVATNAMMGLMAPMSNGVGGDLYAIVYEAKSGRLYGLNASGWSPAGLTPDFLKGQGIDKMPRNGIHSATIPGAVDGWAALVERFGRMSLADVLAPAIGHAEAGFPVTEQIGALWKESVSALAKDEDAARTYLIDGYAPRVGEVFRNPDLAWTYRQIAAGGRDAFYRGEVARRVVESTSRKGGTMTVEDWADYASEWVEPVSTTYRGWTVYEMPPNGQGVAALMMLNIMEHFPIGEYGHNTPKALHAMIEAKKLAYADMLRYNADPHFAKIPLAGLLSKEFGAERFKLIDMAKANCDVPAASPGPGADTIYLSVVDRDGNMVSLIQSNFASIGFGSGIVGGRTGFTLQNRGALFTLDPTHINILAGRKRPAHTIIPAFMSKDDIRIAFGIMGGWNQSQAHAQFVANIVDFGLNIQAAVEAPRFSKETFAGCDVQMEARLASSVRGELAALGHQIRLRGEFSPAMGGGQAVLRDFKTAVNFGASDPRKDGAAIPEPRF
ncbi:MAG: gamma-glutamyltransferase [Proteobacteria bacterium]|nr:gamma-glutamyltransferase [Pseudomonadota bacterium]